MGHVRFISEANPVRGPRAYQPNFLRITEGRALSKTRGSTQISRAAFSTPCFNASYVTDYPWLQHDFRCPQSQELGDYDQRSMQVNWLGLHVLSTVKWKSGSGAV